MRKITLVAILLICLLMITPSPKTSLLGDANGDGLINKTDIELIHQHIIKSIELTQSEKARADINSDGEINLIDIFDIHMIIRGD